MFTTDSQHWIPVLLLITNRTSKKTWRCCCSKCLRVAQEEKDGISVLNISLDKCFLLKWGEKTP